MTARHLTDCDISDFSSETTEWNSTKLERTQDLNVLYQVCGFRADRKDKMATPVSDWLRHSQLLLCDRYLEFNETWKEAKSKRPLPRLCFSGRLEKQDGHPASDWLRHSRLLLWNRWMEFNKIHRKQDLNVFYHVCVFRVYRRNKIAAPACDWLRHFRFLLWNHWMEFWFAETFRLLLRDRWTRFNETWQEARSQRPLPICVIRADKKGRPGLWLAETFSTSPLWPLNRIQRNLTGSKISTSSTKFVLFDRRNLTGSKISMSYTNFVFLGRWEKQDGCPGLWLTETFSTSPLNGIQQNLTGNKICQRHLPSLCFSGRSEKHVTHVYDMWPLGLLFVY